MKLFYKFSLSLIIDSKIFYRRQITRSLQISRRLWCISILTLLLLPPLHAEEVLRLPLDPIIRDSTIQRFEYTYELAHKMLKRFLKMNAANPHDIDALSFKELVRLAAVNGLINNPEDWFVYRKARNDTSHGYDENKAVLVYNQIQPFAQSATSLLIELKKRINQV